MTHYENILEVKIFSSSAGSGRQESLINIDPDEEDDDLIYECPGLAPHGEMEVTNPFFLGKDFNMKVRDS